MKMRVNTEMRKQLSAINPNLGKAGPREWLAAIRSVETWRALAIGRAHQDAHQKLDIMDVSEHGRILLNRRRRGTSSTEKRRLRRS